jgi:glycosyltransferase involved in cell wall biosynthesis
MIKFSVITVCFNSADTIEQTIISIISQNYIDFEYIIVDGGSTDGTVEIIQKYKDRIHKFISEKDNGIYDAINKGIALAEGDVICLLNSDDVYADSNVLTLMSEEFDKYKTDTLFAYIDYTSKDRTKIIRKWRNKEFDGEMFHNGQFPPHPTFMVKKEIFDKYGLYRTDFSLSSDFEMMLRLLIKEKVTTKLVPHVIVKMLTGGSSNISITNIYKSVMQCNKSFKINNIKTSILFIPKTLLYRFKQLF